MISEKKSQLVQELTEKLKRAKSLVLSDYSYLSVIQQQKLRSRVKEVGGEFIVTKNTLLKLALEQSAISYQLSAISNSLIGPTATLFSFEDEIAPIKVLVQFAEEFEIPKIKIGFFDGKAVEKDFILELAKIPGKRELQAQLVYVLNSPLYRLVNVFSADLRKLLFVLAEKGKEGR